MSSLNEDLFVNSLNTSIIVNNDKIVQCKGVKVFRIITSILNTTVELCYAQNYKELHVVHCSMIEFLFCIFF